MESRPDVAMNALFENRDGWIGSDAVYSIPLSDESWLWVFGDTLTGQIRDGKRHNVGMVNNSFARQRGWGADARVELLLRRDESGRPTSFIRPQNKGGYFWLWDGLIEKGRLYLFATRLTSPGTITAFDWKLQDQSLLVIDNPLDMPVRWRVKQLDLPFGVFTESYEAIWGLEVLKWEEWLYVFGTTRDRAADPRRLVVARVAPDEFENFERWQFLADGRWQSDSRRATTLVTGVGTEGAVTWVPKYNRWAYVYSPPLDPRIQLRTAANLAGPWSDAVTAYRCPETEWHTRVFCYAGKARLIPGTQDELLISYATNSFDMLADVTADARLYMPRFVRAKLGE